MAFTTGEVRVTEPRIPRILPFGLTRGPRTSVSPTPSFVDQAGVVDSGGLTLTASQQPPARLTRSSTSSEAEDREAAVSYLFFRRLVFFAAFAALAFLFFAMLPS